MSKIYNKAYKIGQQLARLRLQEKQANLVEPIDILNPAQTEKSPVAKTNRYGKPYGSNLSGVKRTQSKSMYPKLYGDNPYSSKRVKRKMKGGLLRQYGGPSMQDRYLATRDAPTRDLKNEVEWFRNPYNLMPKKHYKLLSDELKQRNMGGTGSYSRDLSTVQKDVNKFRDQVQEAYVPNLRSEKQERPSNRIHTFQTDYGTTENDRLIGDLSEGITLGRRPVGLARPDRLKTFGQGRNSYFYPEYDEGHHNMYARSVAHRVTPQTSPDIAPKGKYEENKPFRPSAYRLTATSDPKTPSLGYVNPILAAHEYAHGEYGMDEVEADALAATTDYDMYDLAELYNMLSDRYGRSSVDALGDHHHSHRDDETQGDLARRGDTHLTLKERMALFADNVGSSAERPFITAAPKSPTATTTPSTPKTNEPS